MKLLLPYAGQVDTVFMGFRLAAVAFASTAPRTSLPSAQLSELIFTGKPVGEFNHEFVVICDPTSYT